MYLLNIFYDVKGNFQWVSMTALAALIVGIVGPSISIYNNKKTLEKQEQMNISNFKGNVVAKARIEWIQEVRGKSVEFITVCYDLFEFITLHKNKELDAEQQKEVSRLKNEIRKNGVLLIMYFGPDSNKNNELIAAIVTSLVEALTSGHILDENRFLFFQERDKVDILKDFLRIYFKAEWKRANGEIKESDIQAYLEQDKLYMRILRMCNNMLEEHEEYTSAYYNLIEIDLRRNYGTKKP
ncbi:hypothetical protein [Bacillus paranthracis]|uniref:hypothetical protein n=1 Tax=Bacillus paranthracis TaxID=2026186 RepID=UPI0013D82DF1|nr:hypothetical protein [Bacillus paranthracis]